jgi:hypothetical protein
MCAALIVVECVLFLLPFDFLMEQLHCSEPLVAMFCNVYSMFCMVWFSLFYMFIHLWRFCVWLRSLLDWWLYKPKHVAHFHTIKTNKLIIHSECEWDSDSSCVDKGKTIKMYKLTQQDALLEEYTNTWYGIAGPGAVAPCLSSRKGETGFLSLKVVHTTDIQAGKSAIYFALGRKVLGDIKPIRSQRTIRVSPVGF